ncbi:hypothetical protein H4S08_003420 [Coemansia sp. RSA 1365]|nr:hypothetical protein H4S08_003420 [Coemansia sp. RSA 1365]
MTDLDLDSKAILSDLVYFDKHNCLPPDASSMLQGQKQPPKTTRNDGQRQATATAVPTDAVAQQSPSVGRFPDSMSGALQSPTAANITTKGGTKKHGAVEPHAIATLKVETSAVLKELARFRSCDDQTMSCFYCREWAQWVYRKQISLQTPTSATAIPGTAGATSGSAGGGKKKKRAQGNSSGGTTGAGAANTGPSGAEVAERERMERRRNARACFSTVGDLCRSLQGMVSEEREVLQQGGSDGTATVSRPASPAPSTSSATLSAAADQNGKVPQRGTGAGGAKDGDGSVLIDGIVERVTLWFEGYQFPVADVYEDLTFDFPAGAFPYEDNQDPLDPALLLPALQVTKTFISLPAPSFPLLGNITSELIATHTYPTCQHTKADHPTPSELETQRLIFNSQLQKWRGEYKRSFEREMEPVWQITQLLLKSAQRIETMRVRLFARGCRANREQFLQTIRNRTQPFAEYWAQVSEPYRSGKAAMMTGPGEGVESAVEGAQANGATRGQGKRNAVSGKAKTEAQLAGEVDSLVTAHLDNLREVSASWSRTFLESYYGVAREFARELETILGECITMCDRRAQGLKYPPPLTLQPQLARARAAISRLQPQLDARIERIQRVVEERNAEIFAATTELRSLWAESSGATVQTKLARAAHKDFRKRLRRVEYQQQTGVIGWAMRELEHLLTAPDVAAVVVDCLELLMTEAEILERAVGQVFVRKLEPTTDDLCEQRQDIVDDFTEGLLTGREELAGIIGKLMLKEAWRILEANISLQRQRQLLDSGGGGSAKSKKSRAVHTHAATGNTSNGANSLQGAVDVGAESVSAPVSPAVVRPVSQPATTQTDAVDYESDLANDDAEAGAGKKRRRNKKNKKKKGKKGGKQSQPAIPESGAAVPDEDEEDEHEHVRDSQNPFASLTWADGHDAGNESDAQTPDRPDNRPAQQQQTQPQPQQMQPQQQQQGTQILEHPPQETSMPEQTQQPKTGTGGDDSVAAKARSRRGTNAARYVPGVGFVSDDGVSTTSPQLISSSASFKPPLGVQTSTVRNVTNGRMSPMSAARLVSPASRPHSPLVTAVSIAGGGSVASSERRPVSSLSSSAVPQPLDKETLAQLHTIFSTGSQEAMERAMGGLAHEHLASFALSALNDRRMLIGFVERMQTSVDRMMDNYDQISSKLASFNESFTSQVNETVRLTALLTQAAQEAQTWRDKYNRLVEQQGPLESGGISESVVGSTTDAVGPVGSVSLDSKNATAASSAIAAGVWAPGEGPQQNQPPPVPRDLLGWMSLGQQQHPIGYGSAAAGVQYGANTGFGQFAGMMPHVSGAVPTSFLGNPSFAAAAAHGGLDPASLMMLAGSQGSQQQQQGLVMGMGGLSLGMSSTAHPAMCSTDGSRPALLEDVGGPLSASSESSLSAPTSASLLTALNAGSQPF